MMQFILVLLAIWLVLSIIGFVVKSLLWLGVIAAVLFLATAAWGFIKRDSFDRR